MKVEEVSLTRRDRNARQNIPRRENDKWNLRSAFIPEDGYVIIAVDYCLAPSTRVLTTDLYWKAIGDVQVGESLIGFDEELSRSGTYRHASVQSTRTFMKACMRIQMSNGAEVIASHDHQWVVGGGGGTWKRRARKWVHTNDLKVGDQIGYFCDPWECATSYEAGYLSGILDGEGYVAKAGKVGFAQRPNACLARCEEILANYPLLYKRRSRPKDDVQALEFYGPKGGLRALGIFRPPRLLQHADVLWTGKRLWSSITPRVFVTAVEDVGVQEVVAVQTSSHTFIAEGFLSHNCQLEMRLLAAAAMEPKMIKIFTEGKDIHTGNVEMVFDIAYEDVVKAKKIEKQVKSGELPESALTEYIQLCSRRRAEIKAIGFGQRTQAEVKPAQNGETYGRKPKAIPCCPALWVVYRLGGDGLLNKRANRRVVTPHALVDTAGAPN